jgi:hypothetical protein
MIISDFGISTANDDENWILVLKMLPKLFLARGKKEVVSPWSRLAA